MTTAYSRVKYLNDLTWVIRMGVWSKLSNQLPGDRFARLNARIGLALRSFNENDYRNPL